MTTALPLPLRPTTGSLYVGDLDPSIQEETLNQVFKICGPISSIRVCRDTHTRASLGYAYVNFHNAEDAEKALNLLNYHTGHGGKPWRIMWSHRDPSIRKSGVGNIFIKNLHRDINQQQLYDLFSSFGNILSCKVALDDHGRSKGYGFIHFETKDAADKAIENTNTLFFENKPVYVGPFIPAERRQRNNPEDVYTNIYIKDIDENASEEEFHELVSSLGTTTSVKLALDGSGKIKGFGFANYKTHEEAHNAVTYLNGKKWKSKTLFACRAMKKQEREEILRRAREERKKAYEGVNLYIKNIDESFTLEKLQEEFSKYGQITSLKIMQTETGASKGFGFVCYANREQAKKAIDSLSGQQFGNKNLYVANFQPKEERRQQLQMQHASRAFRHPYYPYTPVPTPPFGAIPRPYPPYSRQGYPQPGLPYVGGPKRGPSKPRGPTNYPQNAPMRNTNAPKRNQPPKLAPVDLPLPLPSLQSLAALPAEQRRQIIGDHLYQLILGHKADVNLAGSLTGIILHSYKDHDDSELIALLEDANELKNQMEEAFNTLEKGRTQQ